MTSSLFQSPAVKLIWALNQKLMLRSYLTYICRTTKDSSILIGRRPFAISHFQNAAPNQKFVEIKENIFKRTWKAIKYQTLEKSRLKGIGYFLYESIADRINYVEFFTEMELPDTFNSWFIITELHVWMLMVKAMEMGPDGRIIRNNIVQAMWEDVSMKGKKLGPENLSAAQSQVRILGDQFNAALLSYDEGLLSDDKVLASALWRRFFEKDCGDPEKLETMVNYVRKQMHYLDNLSEEDFKKRNITWTSLQRIGTSNTMLNTKL